MVLKASPGFHWIVTPHFFKKTRRRALTTVEATTEAPLPSTLLPLQACNDFIA